MKRMAGSGWALALVLAAAPGTGQDDPHAHHSPYAGQEPSGIAGLSRQELDDLENGAGMGLARAAELRHYPGPKHVLELAAELGLSPAQKMAVQEIHDRMLERAIELGLEIVERERHLDRRFAHRHIDESVLREATEAIAALNGELRFVHLGAHLETRELLSDEQVADYDRLRGY